MGTTTTTSTLFPALLLLLILTLAGTASPATTSGDEPTQQPLDPTVLLPPNTIPAFPVVQTLNQSACRLDLSDELYGGVADACGHGGLDRSRCCPVLAAWLFAAHARSALEVLPTPLPESGGDDGPVMPDDSQRCVDSLQSSLEGRAIWLQRPNATCDTVLCFCGIRLHQIGSLTCPAAFNVSVAARNATPTAAVRDLERHCRNASYSGCTHCLQSLQKLKGGGINKGDDRESKMYGRDCQLMGLTWLLARNKTLYIPTVSAVLRAMLFSAHPPAKPYQCSPDQENMPLAVDSLQFQTTHNSSTSETPPHISFYSIAVPLLLIYVAYLITAARGM